MPKQAQGEDGTLTRNLSGARPGWKPTDAEAADGMASADTGKFDSDYIFNPHLFGKLCQATFSLGSVTRDASPRELGAVEHLCFLPTPTLR